MSGGDVSRGDVSRGTGEGWRSWGRVVGVGIDGHHGVVIVVEVVALLIVRARVRARLGR